MHFSLKSYYLSCASPALHNMCVTGLRNCFLSLAFCTDMYQLATKRRCVWCVVCVCVCVCVCLGAEMELPALVAVELNLTWYPWHHPNKCEN